MSNRIIVINDETPFHEAIPSDVRRGLEPRDFKEHPLNMFSPPSQLQLIPRSEWSARIKEQEEQKSSLEHLRLYTYGEVVPSLDQNGKGYCWAHSTTHATMLSRMIAGQPYVPLSAYAVACKIKNFRDEGGWCGLSAKFARENGIPSQAFWPQQNMSRSNDNEATWKNAALHKTLEDWVDLTRPVYDNVLTFDQVATCLLSNIPCAIDLNWWGHSVCALRLVEVEAGSFGIKIWNSWGDSWGDRGMGILQGNRAIPDNAIAIRSTVPSKE